MKIILTTALIICSLTGFGQNTKQDLSGILKEKRDDISPNDFYIQKDGSFQLMTAKYFYKFDPDGKPMGEPQANELPKYSTGNSSGGRVSGYHEEYDTYYEYYGNGKMFFYRMGEGKTNQLIDLSFTPLESVSNSVMEPDVAVKFMDEDHVVMAFVFNASSKNSHGAAKTPKGKVSSFIRVLKIDLETKSVEESFHFIDKIDAGESKFRTVEMSVGILDNEKLGLTVFLGNALATEYGVYTKIDGVIQNWEISLESKDETMLGSIPVKNKENARFSRLDISYNQAIVTWTEEIPKEKTYSLHRDAMHFENGSWETKTVHFPTEIISIMFPGAPLFVFDYDMKNGENYLCLQGNFAKSRHDKNAQNRVVMFNEKDMDNIIAREMAQDVYFFSFFYMEGDKLRNLALDQDLAPEIMTNLSAPMLKKSAMNYVYLGNGIKSRKIGDELVMIHYDWRATMGNPDYMIELVKMPLK